MPYSPQNDMDVYKLSAQLSIINRDHIHSIGELEGKIERLKDEYEKARQELNTLSSKSDHLDGLLEQAEEYFRLLGKESLSLTEKLKLKMTEQVLSSNNIHNRDDYDRLKAIQSETGKKTVALKESFESCKYLYEVYADIAKTYYDISKGDYISRLVAEEQKRRDAEKQNKKKTI